MHPLTKLIGSLALVAVLGAAILFEEQTSSIAEGNTIARIVASATTKGLGTARAAFLDISYNPRKCGTLYPDGSGYVFIAEDSTFAVSVRNISLLGFRFYKRDRVYIYEMSPENEWKAVFHSQRKLRIQRDTTSECPIRKVAWGEPGSDFFLTLNVGCNGEPLACVSQLETAWDKRGYYAPATYAIHGRTGTAEGNTFLDREGMSLFWYGFEFPAPIEEFQGQTFHIEWDQRKQAVVRDSIWENGYPVLQVFRKDSLLHTHYPRFELKQEEFETER